MSGPCCVSALGPRSSAASLSRPRASFPPADGGSEPPTRPRGGSAELQAQLDTSNVHLPWHSSAEDCILGHHRPPSLPDRVGRTAPRLWPCAADAPWAPGLTAWNDHVRAIADPPSRLCALAIRAHVVDQKRADASRLNADAQPVNVLDIRGRTQAWPSLSVAASAMTPDGLLGR